jgi:hypothetical protein
VVGRLRARQDPEKGGLAGAIGAHETGLVALEQPERQLFEERPRPVGLADRLTTEEQRSGHPGYFFCFGFFFSFFMFLPLAMCSPPFVEGVYRSLFPP